MRRLNQTPKSVRAYTCPQCSRQRLLRDFDYTVRQDKYTYDAKDGSKIELFIDICEFCKKRNFSKYFEPSRSDIKRIIKSMQEDAKLDGEPSLEELL